MLLSLDLLVDQYADYSQFVIWTAGGVAVNYAGATASLEIRQNPTDATPLLTVTTTPSASGYIVFGPTSTLPAGAVQINLSHAATASLSPPVPPAQPPRYTLLITWPNGFVQAFATGQVVVFAGNNH